MEEIKARIIESGRGLYYKFFKSEEEMNRHIAEHPKIIVVSVKDEHDEWKDI